MRCFLVLSLALASTAVGSPLLAQTAPAASTPPPAAAPGPSPAPGGQSIYSGCVPVCRSGFLCVAAQCVSLCNPACPAGETCTDQGQCVSACNPACPGGQVCTAGGQCVTPAPAAAPAPPPPPAGPPPGSYIAPARPASPYLTDEQPRNPATGRPVGDRFHDGFYLRLGVGFGWLGGKAEGEDKVEGTTTGPSIPVEFAIGGTPPGSGAALGVGSYAVHIPAAKYERGRGDDYAEETADYGSISMIGPFVDVYPDPTQGFHVLAAACLAVVDPGDSDITPSDLIGVGFGIVGGIGYESWVGEQWSAGVMARVQYASVKLENDDDAEADYQTLIPGVLLTMTHH